MPIPKTDLDKIAKYKQDALGTKHIHQQEIASLDWWNNLVDYLAIVVPILYVPARYLAKGTEGERLAEHLWEITAAILAAFAVMKTAYRWPQRAQTHSKLRSENISLATQADTLLRYPHELTPERVDQFFFIANKLEDEDREALKIIPKRKQQYGYREGLKEINPGSSTTTCPICNASPWKFTPGSCDTCGNTPTEQQATITNKESN